MAVTTTVKFQLRRDTSSNWASNNPILSSGEPGVETDTGVFKIGNGSTAWNSLSPISGGSGTTGPTGPASSVTGPTGPASSVTGPTGPASSVTGPTGPASSVTGPTGPAGGGGGGGVPYTGATKSVDIGVYNYYGNAVYATGTVKSYTSFTDGTGYINIQTGNTTSRIGNLYINSTDVGGDVASMYPVFSGNIQISGDSQGAQPLVVDSDGFISAGSYDPGTARDSSRNWRALCSSSNGMKLAAVNNEGYIYTSSDSGVTWTQQSGSGSRDWSDIACSRDGTQIAAAVNNGYIYTSSDSGVTWTEQTGSGIREWSAITTSSNGTKIAAAESGGTIYVSYDSGVSWLTSGNAPNANWSSIKCSSDFSKIVATVFGGQIYNTFDGNMGISAVWTARDSNRQWSGIAGSIDNTNLAAVVFGGYIYTSSDSGNTWAQQTGSGSRDWSSITSSEDGSILYATKVDAPSSVYLSVDFGVIWNAVQNSNVVADGNDIVCSSNGNRFVLVGGGTNIYTFGIGFIMIENGAITNSANGFSNSIGGVTLANGSVSADAVCTISNIQDIGYGTSRALVIRNNIPAARWGFGLVNVEGENNIGSDLNFVAYDNSGTVGTAVMTMVRASSEITCRGSISSISGSAGNSLVCARSSDNGNSVALLQASTASSAVTTRAATNSSAVQLRRDVSGVSGFATETCTDTAGSTATAFTIALDTGLSTNPVGQVNFTIDPKINNQPFCIPFSLQQAFPSNFVGAGTQTITVSLPNGVVGKPSILLHWNYYGIQDDVNNPLSMTCSVQSNNSVGPAIAGSPLSAYQSSGDQVSAASAVVLVRQTNYDNNTATLLFVFTVTRGNFKSGQFAMSGIAMS